MCDFAWNYRLPSPSLPLLVSQKQVIGLPISLKLGRFTPPNVFSSPVIRDYSIQLLLWLHPALLKILDGATLYPDSPSYCEPFIEHSFPSLLDGPKPTAASLSCRLHSLPCLHSCMRLTLAGLKLQDESIEWNDNWLFPTSLFKSEVLQLKLKGRGSGEDCAVLISHNC